MSGGLNFDESKALSAQLFPLGDQCPAIWEELKELGYGQPSSVVRDTYRDLAGSPDKYDQVVHYWIEFAKERLAGLSSPMDILRRKLPIESAYRSVLLDRLYSEASDILKDPSNISPQFEPTIKKYIELNPDDSLRVSVRERIKVARQSKKALAGTDIENFSKASASEKYKVAIDRYCLAVKGDDFELAPSSPRITAFKKLTSNGKWIFYFVDHSAEGMAGQISTEFAISKPNQSKGYVFSPRSRVAARFSPETMVPGFSAVCWFDSNSYGDMCRACDANAHLAKSLYTRIDKLLI